MHDPAFTEEKKIQYEKDKVAFEELSERQKKIADNVASGAFMLRKGLVTASKAVVGVIEAVFNVCLYLPYKIAINACRIFANTVVGAVKLCVASAVGMGRAGLAACRGALTVGEKCINYLSGKGWISDEAKDKGNEKIEGWRENLVQARERVIGWGRDLNANIDAGWKTTKHNLSIMKDKTVRGLEYYGALGLYRGAKWVLNPRTPSGKPLFYWESLNKGVGLCVAAAGFCVFAYQLSKLTIFSKVLHVQVAASFLTDPASLAMRLFKQATLHPAITLGVTALKFVTLPVIAATRQALKTTPLTQGIAYQYNTRLNEKVEIKMQKAFNKKAKDADLFRSSGRKLEKASRLVSIYLRKKSLSFVEKFVEHIVEKASPEFYEGRIKHYEAEAALARNGALAATFNAAEEKAPVNDNALQQQPAAPAQDIRKSM